MKTKVVFYTEDNTSRVLAYFTELKAEESIETDEICWSAYIEHDQIIFDNCYWTFIDNECTIAMESDYIDLQRSLEAIGYNLEIENEEVQADVIISNAIGLRENRPTLGGWDETMFAAALCWEVAEKLDICTPEMIADYNFEAIARGEYKNSRKAIAKFINEFTNEFTY